MLTGASSGIGLAMARRLDTAGAVVLGIGRRPASEVEPPFDRQPYRAIDLAATDGTAAIVSACDDLGWDRIDLLIHNGGIGVVGAPQTMPEDQIVEQIAVNLRLPIALTHALAGRLEAAAGRVVMIGSTAAIRPAANFAPYSATKAALAGLARSLRLEYEGRIDVRTVHPGPTRTAMHARAGLTLGGVQRVFLDADWVARAVLRAALSRKPVHRADHSAFLGAPWHWRDDGNRAAKRLVAACAS